MQLLFSKDSLSWSSKPEKENQNIGTHLVSPEISILKSVEIIYSTLLWELTMLMLKKVPWSLRTQGPTTFSHWFPGLRGAWQYIHKVNILYLFLSFSVRNHGIPGKLKWNGAKMIELIWWLPYIGYWAGLSLRGAAHRIRLHSSGTCKTVIKFCFLKFQQKSQHHGDDKVFN